MWDRKHFLSIHDLTGEDVKQVIDRGLDLKRRHHDGSLEPLLENKSMAMIFRKPSVSFIPTALPLAMSP